ncbi:MAG: hypothetical protein KME32_28655 [Mojavia pulchra JT2-VF2]|jgi:hypothetical protein|uniref:Uncharacterized protein n=1 Tax=Mojavia pulchra JT2-VF2 TaxID=287848 RepID=A0A951UJF9_9NOST|nr:hypothetical protein [Mojavia pulchra JT2-VF2]
MSHPNLHTLIDAAQLFIEEIAKHPDFKALDYQPALTIGDAQTALSYLKHELKVNQKSSVGSESSA